MSPLEAQKSNLCSEECSRLVFYDFLANRKTQANWCRVRYSEARTEILFSLHMYVVVPQQQYQLGESTGRTLVCTTTVHFCCEASYAGTRKFFSMVQTSKTVGNRCVQFSNTRTTSSTRSPSQPLASRTPRRSLRIAPRATRWFHCIEAHVPQTSGPALRNE